MVVGIGASAGGIRALQAFFSAMPARSGMVFIVVMHPSPEDERHLSQVLQAHTAIQVEPVRGRMRMEPDHIYVIPPTHHLELTDGHLTLTDVKEPLGRRAPIDVLFRTLGESYPDGIGMLLSGSSSDGTLGMQALKAHGGVLMVQSPEEADSDTMPRSAIATGLVDFILPAAALAAKLLELRQHDLRQHPDTLPAPESETLQQILRHLKRQTGHDFSGYQHATVRRCLARRLRVVQVESLSAYLAYLHGQAPEAQALMQDLLLSVTRFFRDPEAFEALREQVIPRVFEGKGPGDEVRVWVPGCATGEEAYSLAILLLEQASTLAARPTLQVFASDLDENALRYGRQGLYPASIAVDVAEARLQRFFVRERDAYRVKRELREVVTFTPHHLLQDPPFSRLDLISCRHLLMDLQRPCKRRWSSSFTTPYSPRVTSSWGAPKASRATPISFAPRTPPTTSTAVSPSRAWGTCRTCSCRSPRPGGCDPRCPDR
jgi:two-component system CheB/CheR fusion protein